MAYGSVMAPGCGMGGVRATLLILLLLVSGMAQAVEIIAHRGVPEQALTLAGARAMFGMRQTQWSDGQPVRVFVLPDRHSTHVAFVKT